MRRAAKIDDNQSQIVSVLRKIGASVTPTHAIGKGFPDLVVGYRKRNFLIEVKDGDKVASKKRLTDDEKKWHEQWRGQVDIVENAEQAIKLITS